MKQVFIILGSNINPADNANRAVRMLKDRGLVKACSTPWETEAVGSDGPNFINMAIELCTDLSQQELADQILHRIENDLGRIRTSNKFAPRTMDLDIIIYDGKIVDSKIWSHAFIALPMAELIPDLYSQEKGKTLKELAVELGSHSNAVRLPGLK